MEGVRSVFCGSVELPGQRGNAFVGFERMNHGRIMILNICCRCFSGELLGSALADKAIPFFSQGRDGGSTHRSS